MTRGRLQAIAVFLAVAILLLARPISDALAPRPPGVRVVIWHSQRGAERDELESLLREFNAAHAGAIVVEPLAVPDASVKDKLLRTIPRGAGPDLFIRPHNELGELLGEHTARTLSPDELPFSADAYLPGLLGGVSDGGQVYAAPLTYKALFVFYNTRLLPDGPPKDLETLFAMRAHLPEGTYPFAYDATSLFFQAPFFLGSGGRVFGDDGHYALFEGDGAASFALPGKWRAADLIPKDASYNEAVRLFETEQAAAIICGPWYRPAGAVAARAHWGIAPLFAFHGKALGSFVTVESIFLSSSSAHPTEAKEVLRFLAGSAGQNARYRDLGLPPIEAAAYGDGASLPAPKDPLAAELARVQRLSLEAGSVTPSGTRMAAVWRPSEDVLRASLAGRDVNESIETARYTLGRVESSKPKPVGGAPYGVGLVVLMSLGTLLVVRRVRLDIASPDAPRARLAGFWGRAAVPYLLPGVGAAALLVLAPVVAAAAMSLFEYDGGHFVFVGFSNFGEILFPPLERAFEARSFWFSLGVTVLWTLVNVFLHVALGVTAALLIRPVYVRWKTPIRLLLVLPWAIPNYITALMWKGMFHAQVGAINALLAPFGFQGYSWFDRFGTAFFANLVTNTWLGFPFMMIVTLGALTAIPKEVEEAAILDGASRWQRFRYVILPHIRPALAPSIVLGSVWTFNMFNVVYLVSGGEPGSQTDILVSEAYRWAFERGQRYGYAAAYSVLIFGVLLLFSLATTRRRKSVAA